MVDRTTLNGVRRNQLGVSVGRKWTVPERTGAARNQEEVIVILHILPMGICSVLPQTANVQ